jgi:DNA repair protein RecN (Recombination protein N)
MGVLLSALAKSHQLIVITHSPQVASKASKHFHIYKEETTDRTITRVKSLKKEERVVELAKMLSGDPPSNSAISNAKELIKIGSN